MSHRILLVEDESDIREFVGYNLRKAGYEVFTACDGAEGLQTALRIKPHLILLDRMMPVMDGIETCRTIRQHAELDDTLVVFLTALGEEEHEIEGFDTGADDYISKPIKMQLLTSRVKALLKRIDDTETPVDRHLRIDHERHVILCEDEEMQLPRKEFALLDLLSSSPGRLFTREEIYERIWGNEVVVGDRTIDVHIRKLRQKIGSSHIFTVKGVGYKYVP